MKFKLLIAALLLFSGINAQIANDTIGFTDKTDTLYASPNGGYVSGKNGYGDREKLQVYFPAPKPYSIIGCLFLTGYKSSPTTNPNSKACIKVKRFDATSITTAPFSVGPKETKDSVFVNFNNINTSSNLENSITSVLYANPILVNTGYTIGINFDSLAVEDSLALYTTKDDSASIYGRSWEFWNNRYQRIADTWGLNVDLGIFPIIDTLLTGIKILPTVKASIFPLPANDYITISLQESIENASILILDMQGRLVFSQDHLQNESVFQINTSSLSSGKYIIRINGKEKMAVAPLIIMH
jgi:hypothetical protein